jgi:aminopeptidase N
MNQPHMAPWWFPANDHPRDRAMVRTSITVPKDQQVVANGRRLDRVVHGGLATTTWRAEEPMVPYLAFFAAGHFAVDSGTRDGRPWTVAVSRTLGTAQQRTAMDLMRRTPRLVEWLEQQLGAAYPFSVTGGLTTGLDPSFALENQTRPTYPYLGSSPWAVRTVVHELAHQWFGDSVAVDQWRDTWLNEGTATFFERRWTETHGGQTAARWLRQAYDDMDADDGFWHHQVAEPCPSHASCVDSIFASWVYDRGAMTLQALRNLVGEGDFWEVLRRWAVERAGRTGDTAAFEALAEQVSGRDLGGFFEAWLHTARKPADTEANGLGPLSPAAARPPAR